MRVVPVPCLKDNFAYLVTDGVRAAVVDPSEAAPIEAALAKENVKLEAIWLTHHHWDHVGGVPELVAAYPGIEVVIGAIDAQKTEKPYTRTVDDGDTVTLGEITAKVIHNPGHTLGAVSFYIAEHEAVFTGDTLFAAGCGRVFEGDPPMMFASLSKLAALPPSTKVYFGHEYTASNLRFAAHAEPDNAAIAQRTAALVAPTTPSTIELERATNPFIRAATAEEFARRRAWKDGFK
jgi:hydroxyacylglutathione hydrolase